MKHIKKTISIFLSLLLIFGVVSLAPMAAAENETYQVGDHIQFGTYPQTRVNETAELKAAAEAAVWKSYKYYTGNGTPDGMMKTGDWMQFADFYCGGVKFRAVKFTQYRPDETIFPSKQFNSEQDENGYTTNNVYFFKYEPLIWRVLDPTEGYILCENIIDAQAFQNSVYLANSQYWLNSGSAIYTNNYAMSSIRAWLNYDFYETAFTTEQKANVQKTKLDNSAYTGYDQYSSEDTNDKVFLLSYSDAMNPEYGFDSDYLIRDIAKMAQGTDYAICQGLEVFKSDDITNNGNSSWWMRTAGRYSNSACNGTHNGYAFNIYYTYRTCDGVRPACHLSTLSADDAVSKFLFSADDYVHYPGEPVRENEVPATCKEAGSYDEVVYCTDCGTELSRVKKTTDKLDHTPGEVVKENEVAPTCTEKGSYDDVVYCTDCGDEISRVTVTVDALGHIDEANDGLCDRCGEKMTGDGHCGYCGKIHEGFPEMLVGWFHTFLNLFKTNKPEELIELTNEGVQDGTSLFKSMLSGASDLASSVAKAVDSIQKTLIPIVEFFGKVTATFQNDA